MKEKIKKIIYIFVFLSGTFLFVTLVGIEGFRNYANSIEDNYFVLAVGIDKAETEGKNVKITVLSEKFGGEKETKKESDIITVEGETVFDAIREFNYFLDKKIFWGHLEYIIIGDKIAKEGILDYTEFFMRDSSTRYDCVVAIAKDIEAEELLRSKEEEKEFIPDTLSSIFANRIWLSSSRKIYLGEAVIIFSNENIDAYLPYLEIKSTNTNTNQKNAEINKENEKKSEETKEIYLTGLAIFKGEKLLDYLDSDKSRAINFLTNKIDSSVILIDDNLGQKLSLEVIDNISKITVELNEDKLDINIDVSFTTNIAEIASRENIFYFNTLDEIEKRQSETIKSQIEDLINITKENQIDIFNIDKKVELKYPIKWNKTENKKEIIANAKYSVNVSSKVNRSYHLKESIKVKEKQ